MRRGSLYTCIYYSYIHTYIGTCYSTQVREYPEQLALPGPFLVHNVQTIGLLNTHYYTISAQYVCSMVTPCNVEFMCSTNVHSHWYLFTHVLYIPHTSSYMPTHPLLYNNSVIQHPIFYRCLPVERKCVNVVL